MVAVWQTLWLIQSRDVNMALQTKPVPMGLAHSIGCTRKITALAMAMPTSLRWEEGQAKSEWRGHSHGLSANSQVYLKLQNYLPSSINTINSNISQLHKKYSLLIISFVWSGLKSEVVAEFWLRVLRFYSRWRWVDSFMWGMFLNA